jgi:pimeloyl-ACP methyl ester carboxylesterase
MQGDHHEGGAGPRNIVLVHGAFVDGSSWRAVYDLLTADGYHVAVVQNRGLSLSGDAAATRLIIDVQDGPVVLVGHSYGGAVITEAWLPRQGDGLGLHRGVRAG